MSSIPTLIIKKLFSFIYGIKNNFGHIPTETDFLPQVLFLYRAFKQKVIFVSKIIYAEGAISV